MLGERQREGMVGMGGENGGRGGIFYTEELSGGGFGKKHQILGNRREKRKKKRPADRNVGAQKGAITLKGGGPRQRNGEYFKERGEGGPLSRLRF